MPDSSPPSPPLDPRLDSADRARVAELHARSTLWLALASAITRIGAKIEESLQADIDNKRPKR